MALPSTGQLGAAVIRDEYQGTNPWRISDYYGDGGLVPDGTTGDNGPVPESGEIRFSDFRGAADLVNVQFKLWGAGGGGGFNANGGGGGYITGSGDFVAGTELEIVVGGGGARSNDNTLTAAGGGGHTAVFLAPIPIVTETFTIVAGTGPGGTGFSWDDITWDDSADYGSINDPSYRQAIISSITTSGSGAFQFELEKPTSNTRQWGEEYFLDIEVVELGTTYNAVDGVRTIVSVDGNTGHPATQWVWTGVTQNFVSGTTYTINIRYRDYAAAEVITAGAGGGGAHFNAHGAAGGGLTGDTAIKTNPSGSPAYGGAQVDTNISGASFFGGGGNGDTFSQAGGWPGGGDGRVFSGVSGNGGGGSGWYGGAGGQMNTGITGDSGGGGGSSHHNPSLITSGVSNLDGNGRTPGNNLDGDIEGNAEGGVPGVIGGNGIAVLYVNGTKYTFYFTGSPQSFTL